MKFFHLGDLHLGKRYCEFSLIDDQRDILDKILLLADSEQPDGIIIAGDVYDKSVPSAEAVELFDWFLGEVAKRSVKCFIVSGNHDSAERLSFGSRLMTGSGVYLAPVYSGAVEPVVLSDSFGEVAIYMLPFIKPATVRRFFEEKIESYNDALRAAVGAMDIRPDRRNVLVAHQFVTGSLRSGSEEFAVGDVGNVDADVFAAFDYVALGHIHGAQNVGANARYCGTPLKYSLSEANDEKSVTVVELGDKVTLRTLPLQPLREVVELRGSYAEITRKSFYEGTEYPSSFVHVVLTDEEEVPDALGKLRLIYPFVTGLRYDNRRTRADGALEIEAISARSPMELFAELYAAQNNADMSDKQRALVGELVSKIWEDGQ